MATILVVEDDRAISKVVVDNLEFEGSDVRVAYDGATGLDLAMVDGVDLILLDIMMPQLNGYDVCRRLREAGRQTPVIMLTAKGDKVLGLELGANDYMTKSVGVRELLARVRAVLRRTERTAQPAEQPPAGDTIGVLRVGTSHIDFTSYEATRGGEPVHLSPKAYGLLKLLWERHGQAVTRTDILQQVWGYDVFPTTRTVDNHIAELRAALEEEPSKPQYLLTVHGVGYKLVAATEA
jgi:DNA-binding response OmpR family regulator